MKSIKNFLCVLSVLILFINYIPALAITAEAALEKPVWTVAWVSIPQVRVNVGSSVRTVNFPSERLNFFIKTASVFKNYIETHTNNAVDIQITFINVRIVPEFRSEYDDKIGFRARLTKEIKDLYDIESYDTWMVGWPFHQFWELDRNNRWFMNETNRNFNWNDNGRLTSANLAYDMREIYLEAESTMNRFRFTSIHEFLHITEFWFRDMLNFELPYNIECVGNGHFALHNPGYFGYGEEYRIISEVDYGFFADWLSNRIRDPRSSGNKINYLGIPAEAWRQTPTKITVTLEKNNGSVQTDTVHTRTRLFKPAAPAQTEKTGDRIFRGWYYNEELTVLASFPYNIIGDVTFYAKWGYETGNVLSSHRDAYIDLNSETLVLPASFVKSIINPAYSTDGGRKWRRGEINAKQFPNLLNRKLTLVLTNNYDENEKSPAPGASIITFETIEKRPRTNAERLKINYDNLADPTAGAWTLAKNGKGTAVFKGYQVTPSKSPRTPVVSEADWQFMTAKGVPLPPYNSDRQYYFVRSAPVTGDGVYIPASKPFRIIPANQARH